MLSRTVLQPRPQHVGWADSRPDCRLHHPARGVPGPPANSSRHARTPAEDPLGYSKLSPETRADHARKGLDLGLRHVVAPGQVMGGEQEHVLDSRLLSRLEEALRTALRRAEEAEGIGNAVRLILGYRRGIERLPELEPGVPEPAEVRGARVGEEGLARGDPAPHPLRPQ